MFQKLIPKFVNYNVQRTGMSKRLVNKLTIAY